MENTHLTSVMIPHLTGCYLTASDIGCITTDGQPSIQWSITFQNGIGEIEHESPLDEEAARAVHMIITKGFYFDDLLADCRREVIESKTTDSGFGFKEDN
jgi:hypothetical protein